MWGHTAWRGSQQSPRSTKGSQVPTPRGGHIGDAEKTSQDLARRQTWVGREGGGRGRHQQLAGPLPGGSWSVPRCLCSFPRPPPLKFSPDYPCTQVKIQYITRAHRPGLPGPRQPRPCLPSSVPSCGQTSLVSQLPLPLALCASLCVKILPPPAHLTLGAREEHRPEDLSICHWSPQSPLSLPAPLGAPYSSLMPVSSPRLWDR